MRINKFIALATGMSRRKADELIANHEITVNGTYVEPGYDVQSDDIVKRGREVLKAQETATTILLNKPVGYVCSKDGQGSQTVYDLLPREFHNLNTVGRLDKDSSGLLLLTNDGELAHKLTHPSFQKEKVYEIEVNKPLSKKDFMAITSSGVDIGDTKTSRFMLENRKQKTENGESQSDFDFPVSRFWRATLAEGRNRQIRRTFEALGYKITKLHRTKFGDYSLGATNSGTFTPET